MERVRKTTDEWNETGVILGDNQIGIDTTNQDIKVGDGVNRWQDLKPNFKVPISEHSLALKNGKFERFIDKNEKMIDDKVDQLFSNWRKIDINATILSSNPARIVKDLMWVEDLSYFYCTGYATSTYKPILRSLDGINWNIVTTNHQSKNIYCNFTWDLIRKNFTLVNFGTTMNELKKIVGLTRFDSNYNIIESIRIPQDIIDQMENSNNINICPIHSQKYGTFIHCTRWTGDNTNIIEILHLDNDDIWHLYRFDFTSEFAAYYVSGIYNVLYLKPIECIAIYDLLLSSVLSLSVIFNLRTKKAKILKTDKFFPGYAGIGVHTQEDYSNPGNIIDSSYIFNHKQPLGPNSVDVLFDMVDFDLDEKSSKFFKILNLPELQPYKRSFGLKYIPSLDSVFVILNEYFARIKMTGEVKLFPLPDEIKNSHISDWKYSSSLNRIIVQADKTFYTSNI